MVQDRNITEHFTYNEVIHTNYNIPNIPNQQQLESITLLCQNILEPIREQRGSALHCNSIFRSEGVNRAAGGVPTSDHLKGEAADIIMTEGEAKWVIDNLDFDQLIIEFGWIHISYAKTGNRKQTLRAYKDVNGKIKYKNL